MIKRMVVMVALFLLAISTAAYAQDTSMTDFSQNTSAGVRVSTLGIGIEGEKTLTESIGVRAGVNYFPYTYSGTESDVDYDIDLDLLSVPILVDWHPFKNFFRVSGGVMYNANELKMTAKLSDTATQEIGDGNYTADELGTLTGKVDFNAIAPYVGLGVDTSFGKEGGFGFVFEVGALFSGSPKVDFSATGPIAGDPTFQSELAAEEAELEDELDNFNIYPVLALGISYRF